MDEKIDEELMVFCVGKNVPFWIFLKINVNIRSLDFTLIELLLLFRFFLSYFEDYEMSNP